MTDKPSNKSHDLHTFMTQVTQEIASEYNRIYARAAGDPGTAGDEGEENWANLFRDWLPPNYHVETKGRLIDHNGIMSPQVDIVVLTPSYPKKLREKKVWLAAGVVAAFECKTTLTAAHIKSSIEKCNRFKQLFPQRLGAPAKELNSSLFYALLAHSYSWKGQQAQPVKNVTAAYEDAVRSVSHPRYLIDAICVADLATWHSSVMTYIPKDWLPDQAIQRGLSWGVSTGIICSAFRSERQAENFTPIGSLIATLYQRLARTDPSVRDLAEYFRMAGLFGAGEGNQKLWPPSVYSQAVIEEIDKGRLPNSTPWDWNEWPRVLL